MNLSNNNPYSPFKAAHHLDRIHELRDTGSTVPLQVQLIISDFCNHNCSFCAYRMDNYTSNQLFGVEQNGIVNNNPNRMIPLEKCLEILQDCKYLGVKAIQFTGGGEPTVHPNHSEIFKKTLDLGLDLALVTNGTVLRPETLDCLVQGKWVRISVDAGNAKTYSTSRCVPESFFNKTCGNIKRIVDKRSSLPESQLLVGVGFVVTKENYNEVLDAAKIFSDLGVDNLRISAAFTPDNSKYHENHYLKTRELIEEAKTKYQSSSFKIFDLFGDRLQDLEEEKPEYNFCPYMNLNVYIGGDLNVYSCCNNAYNLVGLMGSIQDKSFAEFWNSSQKKDKYHSFNPRNCERCMFNNKNRFMNYLMESNPQHVNYV